MLFQILRHCCCFVRRTAKLCFYFDLLLILGIVYWLIYGYTSKTFASLVLEGSGGRRCVVDLRICVFITTSIHCMRMHLVWPKRQLSLNSHRFVLREIAVQKHWTLYFMNCLSCVCVLCVFCVCLFCWCFLCLCVCVCVVRASCVLSVRFVCVLWMFCACMVCVFCVCLCVNMFYEKTSSTFWTGFSSQLSMWNALNTKIDVFSEDFVHRRRLIGEQLEALPWNNDGLTLVRASSRHMCMCRSYVHYSIDETAASTFARRTRLVLVKGSSNRIWKVH